MAKDTGLSFVEKKKVFSIELIRDILGTIFYCFAAALLGVVLVVAFGMKVPVIGMSMTPTLENTQITLVDRFTLKMLPASRNDVICFYPKGNTNSKPYIKRIVGLPGESIQIKDGYIYIDGVRLIENNRFVKIEDPGMAENSFKLENDEYFVLGDNRNNSEDSRNGNIGAVKKDTVLGRVWFKLGTKSSLMGFIE